MCRAVAVKVAQARDLAIESGLAAANTGQAPGIVATSEGQALSDNEEEVESAVPPSPLILEGYTPLAVTSEAAVEGLLGPRKVSRATSLPRHDTSLTRKRAWPS